ncbi:MAG: hypothetical protein ACC656_04230, partial [Candidatus Heimdallarchaeota archaeon]
ILLEKTAVLKIDGLNSDQLKNLFDKIIFQIHSQNKIQEVEFSKESGVVPSNISEKGQVLNDILLEMRKIKRDLQIS